MKNYIQKIKDFIHKPTVMSELPEGLSQEATIEWLKEKNKELDEQIDETTMYLMVLTKYFAIFLGVLAVFSVIKSDYAIAFYQFISSFLSNMLSDVTKEVRREQKEFRRQTTQYEDLIDRVFGQMKIVSKLSAIPETKIKIKKAKFTN